eukprot:CAMPEP_0196574248 /NCGR_PEP_ID=MMETSP1081-20130531/4004_1 /TAXON_ID=36882 /ORGANISM="Pyramimonas amylifera, Strain CCMP720" /LENGTH=287 /DNA_ID=CAMNT_0041892213 /DNA_START=182 /DNA_END=1047 /DNA_ORIENTATION=-
MKGEEAFENTVGDSREEKCEERDKFYGLKQAAVEAVKEEELLFQLQQNLEKSRKEVEECSLEGDAQRAQISQQKAKLEEMESQVKAGKVREARLSEELSLKRAQVTSLTTEALAVRSREAHLVSETRQLSELQARTCHQLQGLQTQIQVAAASLLAERESNTALSKQLAETSSQLSQVSQVASGLYCFVSHVTSVSEPCASPDRPPVPSSSSRALPHHTDLESNLETGGDDVAPPPFKKTAPAKGLLKKALTCTVGLLAARVANHTRIKKGHLDDATIPILNSSVES